ncbi:putative gEgh 16 protein [Rhizoctonia solani 123E]|uniref:Putative gEgh 16 protein n=1 Tax=Rhizoctonia solani 123E TaxID=1423351 RepID=A0A074RY45_9AGAM|nr:putative gEgh 16 protein [Rhizoctonia solani 123E]
MFSKPQVASVLLALFVTASVNAYGAIVAATGGNGVTGQAFGIVDSAPRDGAKRNPFQTDTSIIRDKEIASGDVQPCGRTLAGGVNNMAAQLATASSGGLPSVGSDGSVTMTVHQINGDGAGPYTCDVSADASGQKFVAMKVTTNVPGQKSRSKAKATDFSLVPQMPAT